MGLEVFCKIHFSQGPGSSEGVLINVLVGGTKEEIIAIKEAYKLSKMTVFLISWKHIP